MIAKIAQFVNNISIAIESFKNINSGLGKTAEKMRLALGFIYFVVGSEYVGLRYFIGIFSGRKGSPAYCRLGAERRTLPFPLTIQNQRTGTNDR